MKAFRHGTVHSKTCLMLNIRESRAVGTDFRVIIKPVWRLPSPVPVGHVESDLFRVTE